MKRPFTSFLILFFVMSLRLSTLAQYTAPNAFPSLTFVAPIEITSPEDGTNRIFVASQSGAIRVFPNNASAPTSTVFVNLASKLLYAGEQGLLGLAFHPKYQKNGYFYVNYIRNKPKLQTVISRFKVSSSDPNQADLASELILLTFDQPFSNHNGGKLVFGNDGYLYIAAGDGGSGGDPYNNAQNRASLLGKILRIDVDTPTNGLNYGIPADNPYAKNTQGFRQEIFAYGMRNPWKISVDKTTGTIWAGDVGQNAREEIDIIRKGGNYGWKITEGIACYSPATKCDTTGLIKPVWDYAQASGAGRSITGGLVYRGNTMSSLKGKYLYGDFVSGNVWALTYNPSGTTTNELLFNLAGGVAAFGEDTNHEIYICVYNGTIRKIFDPLQPIITSFSPNNGLIGSTVTIQGTSFSPVASENTVKFGETIAVITAATATSLTVLVPGLDAASLPIRVTTHTRTFTSTTNFSITKQNQLITFLPLPDRTLNDSIFVLTATASSGLPVTFTVVTGPAKLKGNTLVVQGAEQRVSIQASQSGNGRYNSAPSIIQSFNANKIAQTITFTPPPNQTYGDAPLLLKGVASSGLRVFFIVLSGPASLSGDTLTLKGAGTIKLVAFQIGDDKFHPAPNAERSMIVGKASQNISFASIPDKISNEAPFALQATASSGLPIGWQVVSGPATLEGNMLALTGAGTVTVRASQPGNENYLAAPDAEKAFIVNAVTGEELASSEQVSIYPNPAQEAFSVRLEGFPTHKSASLTLHNTFGQEVVEQRLVGSNNQMQTLVAVSQFSKGIYLLRVKIGERVIQRKVVVE
jgi:glucose/arabinose dehydrogenase